MQKVMNKLRVYHFPQVPCKAFYVEVLDEIEGYRIMEILAQQHLFLYNAKIIPDYSNSIGIEMFDEDEQAWVSYFNKEEDMDWEDFVEAYLEKYEPKTSLR